MPFGDKGPVRGEPINETCPECGSDMVRREARAFGAGKGRHFVYCTDRDCGWEEERTEDGDESGDVA